MTFLSNLLGRIAAALLTSFLNSLQCFFPTFDPTKADTHLHMLLGRIFRRETVIRLNSSHILVDAEPETIFSRQAEVSAW
jgi:hypothetical protein